MEPREETVIEKKNMKMIPKKMQNWMWEKNTVPGEEKMKKNKNGIW